MPNHAKVRRSWQPGPQCVVAGARHWRIAPRTFETKPQRGHVASGAVRSQRVTIRSPNR
jgi:hypothetical protein